VGTEIAQKIENGEIEDVSVLVLVDVWWVRSKPPTLRGIQKNCLGPCFSGCLVGTSEKDFDKEKEKTVSVLVLVDVWWVPRLFCTKEQKPKNCLGPCFSGCLVGTWRHP